MKMPEPILWRYKRQGRKTTTGPDYLTQRLKAVPQGFEEQPLYDKQALIDLLEEAAKECDQERVAHLMFKNYQAAMALANVAD
jgi:hypothetical protein